MENRKITDQDGIQNIIGSFDQLDALRTEELESTKRLQDISNQSLIRERDRLVNKYGDDHPKIKSLDARLSFNQEALKGLAATIQRNHIKVPPFPINSWRIHGKVFDHNGLPLNGLTVFLSGINKQAIKGLKYACTDEQGYYEITLNEREIGELKQESVYLSVLDKNKKIISSGPDPLNILIRTIEYRDLFIEVVKCGTVPPESTDNDTTVVAYPKVVTHPKFVVKFDINNKDQYYFYLTADNGEIILNSRGYKNQAAALIGIQSVKDNAIPERFKLVKSKKKYSFNIELPGAKVIATSEMYDSDVELKKIMELVVSVAPKALVELPG